MREGSLRKTTIFWIRMTFGSTLLIAPYICSQIGFSMTVIFLLACLLINQFSFDSIIKANTFTGHKDFTDLVHYLVPKTVGKLFTVTYGLDMWSGLVCSGVISWNIFLYILDQMGWVD